MNRVFAAWLAAACALGAPRAVFANETRLDAPAPPIMRVYVSGSAAAVTRLSATIRELCARLNLDVVIEEASGESVLDGAPAARLKSFVDLKSRAPRVVVIDARTSREVERRALPTSASLEMSVEEAAHVLYMAAESAFSARTARSAGATADAAPEPAKSGEAPAAATPEPPNTTEKGAQTPEETKPPPVETGRKAPPQREPEVIRRAGEDDGRRESRNGSSRFESQLGAFGTAAVFAASQPLFGVGGSLDGGVRSGAFRMSAAIAFGAYLPATVARDGATASLRAEVGRIGFVGAWQATPAFAPFLSVGGGGDRITMNPGSAPSGSWTAGPEVRIDPMLEALLGAKVRIATSVGAFFAFGADLDLAPHRYVIDANGDREAFLELGRVRPTALLGLSIDLAATNNRSDTGEAKP